MKIKTTTLRKSLTLKAFVLATLLPGLSVAPVPLQANPAGPQVVAGGANFQGLGTANLNVNQSTNSAIINWQSFSIANGEVTTFNQPGVNSVALNRVVSGNPSAIYGALNANGSIIVVNPNGIVVGPSGVIDVAGMLTMSTLDIDDDDFLDGGSNRFQGNTGASITNYGAISSTNGDVVLLGNFLQNPGTVQALDGNVAFGAGGDILVEQGVSGASISVLAAGPAGDVGIDNSGTVKASAVEFATTGNKYALAIQNSGVIRATGAKVSGGRVTLSAGGGSISNTGSIYARHYDGSGGEINITGGTVNLEAGALQASGDMHGKVGGNVSVNAENISLGKGAAINVNGSAGGTASLIATSIASVDGQVLAKGSLGNGGNVDITGSEVAVESSFVADVSGQVDGGAFRAGGGLQGSAADLANAETTSVAEGALIIADGELGNGGSAIIWADGDTSFKGQILATAKGAGNGGFVEVSGKDQLSFRGQVSTASKEGLDGTLLLDPTDVSIGTSAGDTIMSADLVNALNLNNVVIHTSGSGGNGDITVEVGGAVEWSSANDLTLIAHRNVSINDDVQNSGDGNVNLFAGWDGTSTGGLFSTTDALPTEPTGEIGLTQMMSSFGDWGTDGQGNVTINAAGQDDVSVGSAYGQTNVFANRVNVFGGDLNLNNAPFEESSSGQIGYRTAGDNPTGDINVYAKRAVTLNAIGASPGGNRHNTFVMIGHGGSNYTGAGNNNNPGHRTATRAGNGDLSGDITVVSEGSVNLIGGGRERNQSAMIGHGGHSITGEFSGDISVRGVNLSMSKNPTLTGRNTNSGTLIGHGGWTARGVKSGDITVAMTQAITGSSGSQADTASANGGILQIGHGGYLSGVAAQAERAVDTNRADDVSLAYDPNAGGHTGGINISAGTNINITASARNNSYVHFGHGGTRAHGNHTLTSANGAQFSGLNVTAGGDITFDRVVEDPVLNGTLGEFVPFLGGQRSYSQIGLGGLETAGRFVGDINVQANGGEFFMRAGDNQSYAQLGHGGHMITANRNGTGSNFGNVGNATPGAAILSEHNAHATLSGDITVSTAGDFSIYGGFDSGFSYAMVGHGGTYRIADYSLGTTDIAALDQRGHNGDISIDSGGAVNIVAGVEKGGDLPDVVGNQTFALVGHGGWRSSGDHYGNITVDAEGNISVESANGGWDAYNAGADNYNDNTGADNFAMIGHGGYQSILHRAEDISGGGSVNNWRGYQWNGWAGVGIGRMSDGAGGSVVAPSDIMITSATGGLDVISPQESGDRRPSQEIRDGDLDGIVPRPTRRRSIRNFAKIGHGGEGDLDQNNTTQRRADVDMEISGDISINVAGPIRVISTKLEQEEFPIDAGDVAGEEYLNNSYAQIGNGGNAVETSFSGDVSVISDSDVTVYGGTTINDFARIGHGGMNSGVGSGGIGFEATLMSGDIEVISLGSLLLNGGDGILDQEINTRAQDNQFSYAQIGHGTPNRVHTVLGSNITVAATNDITLTGGMGFRDNYAQIGHGSLNNANGNFNGVVDVTAGDNIFLTDTSGVTTDDIGGVTERNYAKIGHGDTNSDGRGKSNGTWDGNIFVKAGDDITSVGGMIGHGDNLNGDADARSTEGDTFIAVGRDTGAPGTGVITTSANADGLATRFSSAGFGNDGELRIYTTDAAGNLLSEGTILNKSEYVTDPATGSGRDDEFVGTEFALSTGMYGEPTGEFTPEGDYEVSSFGSYGIYFADPADFPDPVDPPVIPPVDPPVDPPVGPPGGLPPVVPPPIVDPPFIPTFLTFLQRVGINNRFFTLMADEDWNRDNYVYFTDAYGNTYLIGLAMDDVVYETDPNGNYYYTFAEDALDAMFGNGSGGDAEIISREEAEELLRRLRRAQAGTRGSITFYTFDPGTNKYSSLRLFGVPAGSIRVGE